jgi:hypothetical protein
MGKAGRVALALLALSIALGASFAQAKSAASQEQSSALLSDYRVKLVDAGYSADEALLLLPPAIETKGLDLETLSLYLQEKLESLVSDAGRGKASRVARTEASSGGGSRPRGYPIEEQALDDPDLLAISGEEYIDEAALAELGYGTAGSSFAVAIRKADGYAYPQSRQAGKSRIMAEGDTAYAIALENRSDVPVLAAVFVDGLNTIGRMRELPSRGWKWEIPPLTRVLVNHWKVDGGADEALRFGSGEVGSLMIAFYSTDVNAMENLQIIQIRYELMTR